MPHGPMPDHHSMVLRCYFCSHGQHHKCDGSPDQGTCHCGQCYTYLILESSLRVIESSNSPQILRQAAMALYALQVQVSARRQKQQTRQPLGILPCDVCGKPVVVKRPDYRATYCRDQKACSQRVYRQRVRERQAAAALPVVDS